MKQQLSELVAELREQLAGDAGPSDVSEYLAAEGYDPERIGEVLGLMFPDLPARGAAPSGPLAFRVMGPHERGRFAPEAWGHLLVLGGSGALGVAELEHVIERALTQIDGPIALDDLRALMEPAAFDGGGAGDPTRVH